MKIFLFARLLVGLAFVATVVSTAHAELRDFDAKSLERIRRDNAGRPFVLALWSIHCEPCRDEMGQWAPLQRRYPGIRIVLVATDGPGERPLLEKVLKTYDLAGVETWAFSDEFEERVRYSIDPKWRGELPRTYVFDANHRSEGRSGPAELRWIAPWLERQDAERREARPASKEQ